MSPVPIDRDFLAHMGRLRPGDRVAAPAGTMFYLIVRSQTDRVSWICNRAWLCQDADPTWAELATELIR